MTGSQFHKTSRATTSYSPRLKSSNQDACSCQGPSQRCFSEKQKNSPVKGPTTPVRPGKRRHQAIVSPVTTRSESSSPKTKFRTLSSPVRLVASPPTAAAATNSLLVGASFALASLLSEEPGNATKTEGNPLAVPKVSADPPSPALLPSPPKHWVKKEDAQCLAQKQQCRAVTQCLVSYLASSGILVSAQ